MMRALVVAWVFAVDGGTPAPDASSAPPRPALSAEDLEVVKNLELLENLDSASELELLQELSFER